MDNSANKFFAENFSFEKRVKYIQSRELEAKDRIFQAAVDYGWTALPFKKTYGGLAGTVTDIMCLLEVFGANLNVDPYIFSLLYSGKVIEEMCDDERSNNYINL